MQQKTVGQVKTRGMLLMEQQLGEALETYLSRRYDAGLTQAQIAAERGINVGTVSRWMTALGIEARYFGPRKAA